MAQGSGLRAQGDSVSPNSLIKRIKRAFIRTFAGNNVSFQNTLREEYRKGHVIRAVLSAIYAFPIKKLLNQRNFKEFVFIDSKEYYEEIHELLHISQVKGFELTRIGRDYDGGYIMLDDFHEGGIAYSFGISTDVSWDKDMASRGYDVFMYDHTIEGLPEENSRFHFFRQGISDTGEDSEQLKTLETLIKNNHHEDKRSMILKMDVEGAEWGFLENVSSEVLSQFDQMTFEIHGIINHNNPEQVLEVLRKINKTHKLVHLHANNNGHYLSINHKNFCSLFEVSYVLRDKYDFIDDYDVNLPIAIDQTNSKSLPEIELGRWNEDFNHGEDIYASFNALI